MIRLDSEICGWSDEAAAMLSPIFDDPSGCDDLRTALATGRGSLHRVTEGEKLVGFFSVRIDSYAGGDELVIVAAAGKLKGMPLLNVFLPLLEANAKDAGCNSMRIHTSRKGLFKRLSQRGYGFSEWVLRKKLSDATL